MTDPSGTLSEGQFVAALNALTVGAPYRSSGDPFRKDDPFAVIAGACLVEMHAPASCPLEPAQLGSLDTCGDLFRVYENYVD